MLPTASISVGAEIISIFIDKVVAANFLGESALAAISFFTPLLSFILFVSTSIMVGTLACYSIEMGKMQKERADRFFSQGIILSCGIGFLLAGAFFLLKGYFIGKLSLGPEITALVNDFYGWFLGLAFLIPLNNALQEMIFADGDTRTCNWSYVTMLLGNAVLSILFCKAFGMSGVILGTVLSTLLSIFVLCTHFFKKSNTLKFIWHFNWKDTASALRFSMAESSEFLLFALFSALFNYYFINHFGTSKLAILSMVYEIIELGVIFTGIWMAAEPLINTYRVEENDKGIQKAMRFVNWAALKEGILATVILLLFAPYLTALFHIHSHELEGTATFAIRACAIGFIPLVLTKIYAAYHVHETPLLSFSFVFLAVFLNPLICVIALGYLAGEDLQWIGFGISPFLTIAVGIAFQILLYGKKHFPLLLEHQDEVDDWQIYDLKLTPESLIAFRDQIDEFLQQKKVSSQSRIKSMLLIEEMGMTIYNRNKGKDVYAEISLFLRQEHFILIFKDDGIIMDMTNLEQSVTDLRMYLVNMFMTTQKSKQYLQTLNYNRHVFKFPR